jgi:hypothetical protein
MIRNNYTDLGSFYPYDGMHILLVILYKNNKN